MKAPEFGEVLVGDRSHDGLVESRCIVCGRPLKLAVPGARICSRECAMKLHDQRIARGWKEWGINYGKYDAG